MSNPQKAFRIAVLGCGPKAAALHVQAHSLSVLGKQSVEVVSWDMNVPAANWDGNHGYTNGNCKLGTSPLKDLAFPGSFGTDPGLDKELSKYSWVSYLRCTGQLDTWVDRECPPCTHKQWAAYLRWALQQVNANCRKGTIEGIEPNGEKINIFLNGNPIPLIFDGFVYTGPGVCIEVPMKQGTRNEHYLDAKTYWKKKGTVKGKVCVIGTGESAAAIIQSLIGSKNEVEISVVTMVGHLPMRDEGYSMNRIFSTAYKWKELPLEMRQQIINRGDRGVLSPSCHNDIRNSQRNISEIIGLVEEAKCMRNYVELKIRQHSNIFSQKFHYVVTAIGFDLLGPIHKLIRNCELPATNADLIENIDDHLCISGLECKIHVPGIAGLAQGPGFANLSSLSCTASRIISAYQIESPQQQ